MEYPERIVEFAFCPRPCYQYLADLADPEDWARTEGSLSTTSTSPIAAPRS